MTPPPGPKLGPPDPKLSPRGTRVLRAIVRDQHEVGLGRKLRGEAPEVRNLAEWLVMGPKQTLNSGTEGPRQRR